MNAKWIVGVVFVCCLSGVVSIAAPVPKEAKAFDFVELFGKPEDPSNEGRFKLDGKKLVLTVPDNSRETFPRTRREVTGDFEIETKLLCKAPAASERGTAGAGLVIWNGERDLILIQRTHSFDNQKNGNCGFELVTQYEIGVNSAQTIFGSDASTNTVKLRLRREQGTVTTWVSFAKDERWQKLDERKLEFPETVNVGVFAHSQLNQKFEVTFDSLTIKPLAKK